MQRTVKLEITITLSEKEAAWLHATMQNPLAKMFDDNPFEELLSPI